MYAQADIFIGGGRLGPAKNPLGSLGGDVDAAVTAGAPKVIVPVRAVDSDRAPKIGVEGDAGQAVGIAHHVARWGFENDVVVACGGGAIAPRAAGNVSLEHRSVVFEGHEQLVGERDFDAFGADVGRDWFQVSRVDRAHVFGGDVAACGGRVAFVQPVP